MGSWVRAVLIINPRSDHEFVERARAAAADGADDPATLADQLRVWYPAVVVRPRELSSEPVIVWYVYRDGHWIPEQSGQGG